MEHHARLRRWSDHVRDTFIGRTFPSRVIEMLDQLYIDVHEEDRSALLAGRGLFLYGGVGSGKTVYAAAAMCSVAQHLYVQQRRGLPAAQLITITRLLRTLRDAIASGGAEQDLIKLYSHDVWLLAIDDLGTEKLSDWTFQVMHEIINERYEHLLPTIVTTNADGLEGLATFLGDDRIPSRLSAVCVQRDFGNRDLRLDGQA